MAVWYKVKWIPTLFAAMDYAFPNRTKGSDGTIGDAAHQGSASGHNPDDTPGSKAERTDADTKPEVRAADVTNDLRDPRGFTMWNVVQAILASPAERNRLIYMICNGKIWRAANGWREEKYNGSDQHWGHGHLSGNPLSDEDGGDWPSIRALKQGATPIAPPEEEVSDTNPATDGNNWAGLRRTEAVFKDLPASVGDAHYSSEENKLHTHLVAIDDTAAAQSTAIAVLTTKVNDLMDLVEGLTNGTGHSDEQLETIVRRAIVHQGDDNPNT